MNDNEFNEFYRFTVEEEEVPEIETWEVDDFDAFDPKYFAPPY